MLLLLLPLVCFGKEEKTIADLEMPFVSVDSVSFYVGKYEVTNSQFRAFRERHDSGYYGIYSLARDRQPVTNVSFVDAQGFAVWLTRREKAKGQLQAGWVYRLPRSDEWLRIAGEGTYPWGEWPPSGVNLGDKSGATKHKNNFLDYEDGHPVVCDVLQTQENASGVCGLGGNVAEWADEWSTLANRARAIHGGSWRSNDREGLLTSRKGRISSNSRLDSVGFRLVLAPIPVEKTHSGTINLVIGLLILIGGVYPLVRLTKWGLARRGGSEDVQLVAEQQSPPERSTLRRPRTIAKEQKPAPSIQQKSAVKGHSPDVREKTRSLRQTVVEKKRPARTEPEQVHCKLAEDPPERLIPSYERTAEQSSFEDHGLALDELPEDAGARDSTIISSIMAVQQRGEVERSKSVVAKKKEVVPNLPPVELKRRRGEKLGPWGALHADAGSRSDPAPAKEERGAAESSASVPLRPPTQICDAQQAETPPPPPAVPAPAEERVSTPAVDPIEEAPEQPDATKPRQVKQVDAQDFLGQFSQPVESRVVRRKKSDS